MPLPGVATGRLPHFFLVFELLFLRFDLLLQLVLVFALGCRRPGPQVMECPLRLFDLRLELALLRSEADEADQAADKSEGNGAWGHVGRSAAALFAAEEVEQGIPDRSAAERPESTPHSRSQQDQHKRQQ